MGKKKKKKKRGSRTHGRGRKSGRGAGERGGRGKAGLKKHKWKSLAKDDPDYFGPKGFTRPQHLTQEDEVINIYQVEESLDYLLEEGFASKEGSTYEIDLDSAGFDKLLSKGNATKEMEIKVSDSSERAKEKIEEAGGELIPDET
ncbi:MAG: uL15 family ribosomal protein [Candidatus Thermoplasmatota archaeon]|nr:uL15 family ribosomal protein [Candidatus Thermoplasmatota archaeon]